ncbi:MAG: anti-sigma factor [Anaeromyxobacter sp.]
MTPGNAACRDVEQLLSLRAARALDPAGTARLDAHLAGCPACQDEARALEALLGLVKLPPPSEAERRVLADLPARALAEIHRRDRRAGLVKRWALAAGLAAAVVLAVLAPVFLRHAPTVTPEELAAAQPAPPAWQEPDWTRFGTTRRSWSGMPPRAAATRRPAPTRCWPSMTWGWATRPAPSPTGKEEDMRSFLIALMLCPLAALAQGQPPQAPAPKPGDAPTARLHQKDPEQAEKRMRLARTLGLAEALDLDTAQALKMGDTLEKYDARRKAVRQQAAEARDALRRAARGEKAAPADVDNAIKSLLAARDQLTAIDKEMLGAITKDLTPEKKARAALFLGSFRDRIEKRVVRMGPGGPMGLGDRAGRPGHAARHGPGRHADRAPGRRGRPGRRRRPARGVHGRGLPVRRRRAVAGSSPVHPSTPRPGVSRSQRDARGATLRTNGWVPRSARTVGAPTVRRTDSCAVVQPPQAGVRLAAVCPPPPARGSRW